MILRLQVACGSAPSPPGPRVTTCSACGRLIAEGSFGLGGGRSRVRGVGRRRSAREARGDCLRRCCGSNREVVGGLAADWWIWQVGSSRKDVTERAAVRVLIRRRASRHGHFDI